MQKGIPQMSMTPQSSEFREIQNFLFKNNPQPGERVATEDEVMNHFGLTRYRVRQAFDLLVQMGLLERSQRRGTIVKRPAASDMTLSILEQFRLAGFDEVEFNEARLMIELAVVPYAAMRITPATQAEMRRIIAKMRENADNPLAADSFLMEFHIFVLRSCGNRVMEVFASVVRTYFHSTKHLIKNAPREYFLERADLCERLLKSLVEKNLPDAEETIRIMLKRDSDS